MKLGPSFFGVSMKLRMRPVELVKDYPMLKSWWDERSFPPALPEFLPPTGLLVASEDLSLCAGFLFKSDANIAIIGNLVSNPSAPKEVRSKALDSLIDILTCLAKKDGFGLVSCATNLVKLMPRFEALGFAKMDEQVSHFGRML